MISKATLYLAKAFLCWEAFHNLSVQIAPVQNSAAYYYPPENVQHAIVLFYQPDAQDFSEPLFLLFHEAGHAKQWMQLCERKQENYFHEMVNLDKGDKKVNFEKDAWGEGRQLFIRFIQKECLNEKLLAGFDLYSMACAESYSEG